MNDKVPVEERCGATNYELLCVLRAPHKTEHYDSLYDQRWSDAEHGVDFSGKDVSRCFTARCRRDGKHYRACPLGKEAT
jgi:hypothetical protein